MIKVILGNSLVRRMIKFGIVGGLAFAASYLTYFGFCQYHLTKAPDVKQYYLIYKTLGDIVGLIVGFYINKYWTFRHEKRPDQNYFGKYFGVYLVTFFIGLGVIFIIIEYMPFVPYRLYVAPLVATGVGAILNFIGTNNLVFKVADKE
jgi:putative flippase GtrA